MLSDVPHGHSNAAAVGVKPNCVHGFGAGVSPSARNRSSTAGTSIVSQLMSSAVGRAALDVGLTDGLGEGVSVAGPGTATVGVGSGVDGSPVQAVKPAAPQINETVAQSHREEFTLATYRTVVLGERAGFPIPAEAPEMSLCRSALGIVPRPASRRFPDVA